MSRARNLSVPGEAPQDDDVAEALNPIVDGDGLVVGQTTDQVDSRLTDVPGAGKLDTAMLNGTLEQQVAAMAARQRDLEQLVRDQAQMLRGVLPQKSVAAAAVLPTLDEVKASKPNGPTETRDGWYVPRVTTGNPEQLGARSV